MTSHNLPGRLTSFIGRESELEAVHRALARVRLLTLTGAGGSGKTRLALAASAGALDRFPDGVYWVALEALAKPEMVGAEVAAALGVRPLPGQSHVDAAASHLRDRRAMIVIDNCEHLLSACADAVALLVQGCPDVTVLATSRARLGVSGETEWRVPSLSLPNRGGSGIAAITRSDAVRLFIDRAARVRPSFEITDETAAVVVQICQALDGLPLAIELAAARTRMMSLEQIAAGLGDRFHLLTGGGHGVLPRHQTLRGSVDWSHELLSNPERRVFRRLAVFAGGFTLEAVEDVGSGHGLDRQDVLDLLTSLVDKSLVVPEERGSAVRYRLLETVREYARERLVQSGELAMLRDRHRDFFLELAERAGPALYTPRQEDSLALLDPEAGNFAAAIDWALESDAVRALRLCVALTFWRRLRGRFAEADAAYARALEVTSDEPPSSIRARALWGRAWLKSMAGDYGGSFATAEEALATAEKAGDESAAARALDSLGLVLLFRDPVRSRPAFERSRELASAADDDWCWIDSTMSLGASFMLQGQHDEALALFDDALPLIERHSHREFLSLQYLDRGAIGWGRGAFVAALEAVERSLAISREVGEPVYEPWALGFCAWIEAARGNTDRSLEHVSTARERAVAAGVGWSLNWVHICGGYAQAARGDLEAARAELEAATALGAAQGGAYVWDCLALRLLAEVRRLTGAADAARGRAEEALGIAREIENRWYQAQATLVLAGLSLDAAAWAEGEALVHDALGVIDDGGFGADVPHGLDLLAGATAGLESHEESARILGAAARCREELGIVRWIPHERQATALVGRLGEALGEDGLRTALEEGHGLEIDEAVAWIRRARGSRKRPRGGWESLTPTELKVVQLAAEGLTNPEIGERMFISRGTVKGHLSHIYAKLGVKNRSDLAAQAARR